MVEIDLVEDVELVEMKQEIKESKNEWLETFKKYDNPDISMEDIW